MGTTERVKVVLRRWRDTGDIIALMPEIEADNEGHVESYMHIGQHAAASYPQVVKATRPVTLDGEDKERDALMRELTAIGYEPRFMYRR